MHQVWDVSALAESEEREVRGEVDRRRLREVVRQSDAPRLQPGHDYVVIGRRTALNTPFEGLIEELDGALRRLHGTRSEKSPSRPMRDAQG